MPKRHLQAVKRQRPLWWTQQGVLDRLQSGQFILAVCQDAVDEMAGAGVTISVSRLRHEVSAWCESATWGDLLRTAMSLWKRTSSGEVVLSKEWHEDFLASLDHCDGNAPKAATMAGVGYGVVLAVLDKRNRCYDPEFAEKFRIAEAVRAGRIREKYMDLAENGEGKDAVRAQEKIIESALPSLHGTKQEVLVSGKVDHAHQHQHRHLHGVDPDLMQRVVSASQDRVRRLNFGQHDTEALIAAPSDDEDRVIDVTPQQMEVMP